MEKKRYWLKLDKDFLSNSQAKVIKSMNNGKEYMFFYLALLLESIETIGHLRFSDSVPYNSKMLASVTDTDVDIVESALKLFKDLGLIEILDDGTIFMTEAPKLTGKESESTSRVRAYRERQKNAKELNFNSNVTTCNANVTECSNTDIKSNDNKEKDKQRTKNKEQRTENKEYVIYITTITKYIEENFARTVTPVEYEAISSWLQWFCSSSGNDNTSKDEAVAIIKYAIRIAVLNNKKTFGYVEGILKNWKSCSYKTLSEIKEHEIKNNSVEKIYAEEVFTYNWLEEDAKCT